MTLLLRRRGDQERKWSRDPASRPKGIVSTAGRILAANKWAEEIKQLKDTVNQAKARWQAVRSSLPTNSPSRNELALRSPAWSTS